MTESDVGDVAAPYPTGVFAPLLKCGQGAWPCNTSDIDEVLARLAPNIQKAVGNVLCRICKSPLSLGHPRPSDSDPQDVQTTTDREYHMGHEDGLECEILYTVDERRYVVFFTGISISSGPG